MKNKRVTIEVANDFFLHIERVAIADGLSISTYIRRAVKEKSNYEKPLLEDAGRVAKARAKDVHVANVRGKENEAVREANEARKKAIAAEEEAAILALFDE